MRGLFRNGVYLARSGVVVAGRNHLLCVGGLVYSRDSEEQQWEVTRGSPWLSGFYKHFNQERVRGDTGGTCQRSPDLEKRGLVRGIKSTV